MSTYNYYKENAKEKNIELITREEVFNESELMQYRCGQHGIFDSRPKFFRYTKYGCEKCSYDIRSRKYNENENNKKYNKKYFEEKFKTLEFMKNDYTIEYIKNSRKINLICSKHGLSERFPHQASDTGCLNCRRDYKQKNKEEEKANIIDGRIKANQKRSIKILDIKKQIFDKFGDEYEYDFSEYKTKKSLITVKCKKHGEYKTKFSDYISNFYGCRSCSNSGTSISERNWLIENNIKTFQFRIKYDDNRYYFVDGYDEKTNTVYEYLGDYWHGNLKLYDSEYLNKQSKKTMGELFDATEKRFVKINELEYNIVYIWESSNESKIFSGKLEI